MLKISLAIVLLVAPLSAQEYKAVFYQFAGDQKQIWSGPARIREPKVLVATAAVAAATAGLLVLDKTDSAYFRQTTSFNEFNKVFNGSITEYGTLAVPAALFATGFLRNDPKMTATSVDAAAALGDAELLAVVTKDISHRSLPSGHAASAFAVATVVSRHYSNHRWVPWVAYGLASAVGFSRVTTSAHLASDVFVGAVLGYSIGRLTEQARP